MRKNHSLYELKNVPDRKKKNVKEKVRKGLLV